MKKKNARACARSLRVMFCCISLQLLGAGFVSVVAQDSEPAEVAPPNFVVIMTDDQTVESMRVMPKTRALIARMGTTFSNNFSTFPMCCPSRATFLTGQYPHNHGVWDQDPVTGGYHTLDHSNTLPVWLEDAGYYTVHIGKYLNGYGVKEPLEVPPGWSHWQGLLHESTYQMYDYTINDNGKLVTYSDSEGDYQTDVLADRAVIAISEAVRRKQPFFLSIAPLAPHSERRSVQKSFPNPRPAPRDEGVFAKERLPRPPSFNEPNVTDKPKFIRSLAPFTKSVKWKILMNYRSRLASLLAVDDLVWRIVNRLTTEGVIENTVLILTSDNGFFHGEHRIKTGKVRPYDESARVPLLIRGGGFPKGVTASQIVANIDLAPTIVRLSGARPRRVIDGQSLLPLALNPKLGLRRDVLIETRTYKAVRNQSFLYVDYDTGEREIYDMRRGDKNYDPYQLESRHDDSDYHNFKARLAAKLDKLRTCSGISCSTSERRR